MDNTHSSVTRGATWGAPRQRNRWATATAIAVLSAVASPLALASVASASQAPTQDPITDPYSMAAVTATTGLAALWDQGYTGAGIDVAVIDTGVSPVPGLEAEGKIVYGPDLSLESQNPAMANLDTNGHGTFMAGLIAGHDAELTVPYSLAPATAYRGAAPDARIVSLKVGAADGGVDITQMIAAINWVVDHKNDNGMNIRVLNLSFGTDSRQRYDLDPLSQAAERAWHAGIVVVVAAGNTGTPASGGKTLADPAYNPWLLAVGAYDTQGTADPGDDAVAAYSARTSGRNARNPDVVAVGSRVQGLRVGNSWTDETAPHGRIGDRYFRGSGTSEATAIASGTVALLLQKYPQMSPEQVKQLLVSTARPLAGERANAQGAGAIDAWALAGASPARVRQPRLFRSSGRGSLELSRGTMHLAIDGVELRGEVDIFGRPFLPGTGGSGWSGGTWNGSTWSGSTWSGSTWSGSTWSGSTWSGSTWSGSTWSGSTWSGSTWSGSTWSGSTWSGSTWSGSTWSGSNWSSSVWD